MYFGRKRTALLGGRFCYVFLQSQRGGHLGDEVLGVGDDALCTQAAPVGQLVGGKVGGVHAVEIHRTDCSIILYSYLITTLNIG